MLGILVLPICSIAVHSKHMRFYSKAVVLVCSVALIQMTTFLLMLPKRSCELGLNFPPEQARCSV